VETSTQAAIPREGELLLCFARLTLGDAERARIAQLIAAGPDWPFFLRLAASHGLGPLVHRHLEALGEAVVPRAVFARLWCSYEAAARRNGTMAAELSRIADLFEYHGIRAIPYKGPALAQAVYGDLALREFNDLDILLRAGDLDAAKSLLVADGYSPEFELKPRAQASLLRSKAQYHLALLHPVSGVMVELHWKTDPDFPVESLCGERLWSERPSDGSTELGFAPAELLLVLCLHGGKHRWARLAWLVDIAELIRQSPQLDWAQLGRMARTLRAERRLRLGLDFAQRLLGVELPAQFLAMLGHGDDELATNILAAMFARQETAAGAMASLSLNLRLYDRIAQRVRHLVNVVLEPSLHELSIWALPRRLSFLYIPVRLARLINKHGRMLRSARH
jgi:hypothetical protein